MKPLFRIIIWEWQKKLAQIDVEFDNLDDASIYAMGVFKGMKLGGANPTGYECNELAKLRNEFIVSDETAQAQQEICENLYHDKDKGISAVYDYANKVNMPYTTCQPCEASTPTVVSKDHDLCALCGSEKNKQKTYR